MIIIGIGGVIVKKIHADEYTPTNFASDYDNFEIIIGENKTEGRYYTLHYEFKE